MAQDESNYSRLFELIRRLERGKKVDMHLVRVEEDIRFTCDVRIQASGLHRIGRLGDVIFDAWQWSANRKGREELLASPPIMVRKLLAVAAPGLTIYFDSRVTSLDRFLVDSVILSKLGEDTDCHVESFDQTQGRAVIRLVASNPNDLFAVADALAERVWEQPPGQSVVNEGDVEQQFIAGRDVNVGVSEAELQAQRESLEAQLRVKDEQLRVRDEQIVVLQGKLATAVSDLVDRIDRMVYRPGADEEGEERTWMMGKEE